MTQLSYTSRTANQYDALKCLALLAMTIDHFGFFLIPGDDWLRIIGRSAAPIFLLLVGYNNSFRFRTTLLIAAAVMSVLDGLLVDLWVPQNILWTILVVRAVMELAMPRVRFHELALISVIMIPFTMPILDFGSFGLLFALVGQRLRTTRDRAALIWLAIGLALFGLYTYHMLLATPDTFDVVLLTLVLTITGWSLWHAEYLKPIEFMPRVVAVFAASALTYYVGHKAVLEVIKLLSAS
jgi:hypothetical protein